MSKALYRRYRPDNFEQMIGQEQVTAPLMQALRSNRVNHAYLFSGPRGCGKTTSARILARILNCHENTEESPKDTPCEVCPSCMELARGGSGSLDVVEIDAASHGGVEDARELRERATFSPSRDRFKIFILDEAHMVTTQGFNALLKIVEEPPSYLKFIFATTEPDKVIGTIRSRTHHYPFKLVGPQGMQAYLEQLCTAENIAVGSGVLPLVVRAGGGSVRDTLSVLDQLMAGSGAEGLEYDRAVGLLGFTPVTLLDDVVEALSARDGASMFRVVEQIISTGHEPRRFVEDLLERLRDLVIIALSGDNAQSVLTSIPQDQFVRMSTQATNLGASELSRSADVVNDALTSMTGATSPRLHLELLCARLLLPAADSTTAGLGARIDGLERAVASGAVGMGVGTDPGTGPAVPQPISNPAPTSLSDTPRKSLRPDSTRIPVKRPESTRITKPASEPATSAPQTETAPAAAPTPAVTPAPAATESSPRTATPPEAVAEAPAAQVTPAVAVEPHSAPEERSVPEEPTSPVPSAPEPVAQVAAPARDTTELQTEALRRRWPEVLETLSGMRRATWTLVDQHAQVAGLSADTLQIAFPSPGLMRTFENMQGPDLLQAAIKQTLGFDVSIAPQLVGAEELPKEEHSAPTTQAQVAPVAYALPAEEETLEPHQETAPQAPDGSSAADTPPAPVQPAERAAAPEVAPAPEPNELQADPAASPVPVNMFGAAAAAFALNHRVDYAVDTQLSAIVEPVIAQVRETAGQDEAAGSSAARGAGNAPYVTDRPAGPDQGSDPYENAPGPNDQVAPWEETPRQVAERQAAEQVRQEAQRVHVVDDPQPDDEDLEHSSVVGVPLIIQKLGGVIIEENTD